MALHYFVNIFSFYNILKETQSLSSRIVTHYYVRGQCDLWQNKTKERDHRATWPASRGSFSSEEDAS